MVRTGRPKKYDFKKYSLLYDEYIERSQDVYEKLLKSVSYNSKGEKRTYDYRLKVNLPTVKGFASFCGINRDTIYDWSKKYDDFSDIIEDLKQLQELRLIKSGLSGEYNAKFTKLMLVRHHGYREK